MVNLLKKIKKQEIEEKYNNVNEDFSEKNKRDKTEINEAEPETPRKQKKISIDKYVDPEGLSVTKMSFGLWFIKNKPVFTRIIYGILGLIGFITWPLFFYTFGKYVVL